MLDPRTQRPTDTQLPTEQTAGSRNPMVPVELVGNGGAATGAVSSAARHEPITAAEDEQGAQWRDGEEGESGWFDRDAQAFTVSLLFHVVLLLGLAVVPLVTVSATRDLVFKASLPTEQEDEFTLVEDVAVSQDVLDNVGANSNSDSAQALSMAPVLAELSEVPSPSFELPQPNATFDMNNRIDQAMGLTRSEVVVKGMTGVGATGTDGAVDQITYEILRSMEERPTLVVWFFDQSGSLQRRRQEIRDRFDRIYKELGIVAGDHETAEHPQLLTSIFAFGEQVNLLTAKPTADLAEIRQAIDSIEPDASGVERVFSALYKGVDKFKRYRHSPPSGGPDRNIMFIAVTDERGDDDVGLEATIKECRKFAIPVYVIGVPSPFGRKNTYVKYVDPDPEFDQTPQWAEVDQGPESIMPERVKLGYRQNYYAEPVIDSGFGPYALSRLAYETGGIYFTVHPNRRTDRRIRRNEIDPFAARLDYFFEPELMEKYRPDYVTNKEYMKRVNSSPLRQVLVRAAAEPPVETLTARSMRFVKEDDAGLANDLTVAQREPARVQQQLERMLSVLLVAEEHRDKEVSPRWLAGFDLALGTVLVHKVRAETCNAMLAKAKRGMNFEDGKNNTWILEADDGISVGSKLEKEGKRGVDLLRRVADEHQGTPWGLLAQRELARPVGWKWVEEFTDPNPPPERSRAANPNNPPRAARDDQARMLDKPAPKRPIPKL